MRAKLEAMTTDELVALLREQGKPEGYGSRRAALAAKELGVRDAASAAPALIEALADPNYLCVCAASALARIGDPEAIPALLRVLDDHTRFWVPRGAAAHALGRFGVPAQAALPGLRKALAFSLEREDVSWDARCIGVVQEAILRIEAAVEGREQWCESSEIACPRCDEGQLLRLPSSPASMDFFECSGCGWGAARGEGEEVHDRWGSPISLALYGVIFARDPCERVEPVASQILRNGTQREMSLLRAEIERELREPTQKVTQILDLIHAPSEARVREFLRRLGARLARSD